MSFRLRKSFSYGPFRLNISKSGLGYSAGTKGFRITKRSDGKIQQTTSLPGTGLSHVKTYDLKQTKAKSKKYINTTEHNNSCKKKHIVLFLCIFLGLFGIHRFYVGKIGTGILYLFTCGFFGIGLIFDIFLIIMNLFTDYNGDYIK